MACFNFTRQGNSFAKVPGPFNQISRFNVRPRESKQAPQQAENQHGRLQSRESLLARQAVQPPNKKGGDSQKISQKWLDQPRVLPHPGSSLAGRSGVDRAVAVAFFPPAARRQSCRSWRRRSSASSASLRVRRRTDTYVGQGSPHVRKSEVRGLVGFVFHLVEVLCLLQSLKLVLGFFCFTWENCLFFWGPEFGSPPMVFSDLDQNPRLKYWGHHAVQSSPGCLRQGMRNGMTL